MSFALSVTVYDNINFHWRGALVNSYEVTSFTNLEIDNPHGINVKLSITKGDIYVLDGWEDENLKLIEHLMNISSVLEEIDEILDDLVHTLVIPVYSKFHGTARKLFFHFDIF